MCKFSTNVFIYIISSPPDYKMYHFSVVLRYVICLLIKFLRCHFSTRCIFLSCGIFLPRFLLMSFQLVKFWKRVISLQNIFLWCVISLLSILFYDKSFFLRDTIVSCVIFLRDTIVLCVISLLNSYSVSFL